MVKTQLEHFLKRDDIPSDVKQIVINHLQENQKEEEISRRSTEQFTKFKQTKKDLRESEDKLRVFMDAVPVNFTFFDSKLRIVHMNLHARNWLSKQGINLKKVIGTNLLDINPTSKETGIYDKYLHVIRTGESISVVDIVSNPKFGDRYLKAKAFKVGDGLGVFAKDTTEHKQIEEALLESEAKYRFFVENFQGIAFRGGGGFTPVFFHGNAEEITGYTEEEFIAGQPTWDQVIHPDDLPQFLEETKKLSSKPSLDTEIEHRIIHKNGQIRWVVGRIQNIIDDSGNSITQGTIHDITERKLMEELMKVQRDLGIALSSTDNLTEALNYILQATIKIEEIDSGEIYLIDQNIGILYLACHVGLSKSFVKSVSPIDMNDPRFKLVMKGESIYAPFRQVTPSQLDKTQVKEGLLSIGVIPVLFDGKVVAVLNVASHTHEEISKNTRNSLEAIANQIRYVIGRIRDEEALRESEHRFRAIFDNATDGILLVDPESKKFHISNDIMSHMLGFSHEEIENLGVMNIHPKEDLPNIIDQFEKQARGEINIARDIPVKRKDGRIFYADISSSPIILRGKSFMMGIFRDITERRLSEKTKEDLEKKRSAFISMTSHELRTPITVIKGYTDFLNKNIENVDSIRKAKAILSISRNVLRLERLIEGVADITRMDQGIFELNPSICDFSKFLKESTQPYKELYGQKFSIHGTLESKTPVYLNIDIDRLRQVLDNLMDNANKNTPEDGVIVFSPTVLSNTIKIEVSDTGVGIEFNDLKRIFDQFVSITTDQASGGTGIGLYVSKIICEAHEGTLTAHSEGKNQGATFIVELPRWFEERSE